MQLGTSPVQPKSPTNEGTRHSCIALEEWHISHFGSQASKRWLFFQAPLSTQKRPEFKSSGKFLPITKNFQFIRSVYENLMKGSNVWNHPNCPTSAKWHYSSEEEDPRVAEGWRESHGSRSRMNLWSGARIWAILELQIIVVLFSFKHRCP